MQLLSYESKEKKLVLDHTISFVFNNTTIKMKNFSFTKFFKLYLTSNLPTSVRARDLRTTEDYFNLLDHIEQAVGLLMIMEDLALHDGISLV